MAVVGVGAGPRLIWARLCSNAAVKVNGRPEYRESRAESRVE